MVSCRLDSVLFACEGRFVESRGPSGSRDLAFLEPRQLRFDVLLRGELQERFALTGY